MPSILVLLGCFHIARCIRKLPRQHATAHRQSAGVSTAASKNAAGLMEISSGLDMNNPIQSAQNRLTGRKQKLRNKLGKFRVAPVAIKSRTRRAAKREKAERIPRAGGITLLNAAQATGSVQQFYIRFKDQATNADLERSCTDKARSAGMACMIIGRPSDGGFSTVIAKGTKSQLFNFVRKNKKHIKFAATHVPKTIAIPKEPLDQLSRRARSRHAPPPPVRSLGSGMVPWAVYRIQNRAMDYSAKYEKESELGGLYKPSNAGNMVNNVPKRGGEGVHIFLPDTGIDIGHPDFGGRAVAGWSISWDKYDPANEVHPQTPGVPCNGDRDAECAKDLHGHGTHITGILIGKRWGVAKAAKVHNVRVFSDRGVNEDFLKVIPGFEWIMQRQVNGPKVISLSETWYEGEQFATTDMFQQLADRLENAGITFVTAAGNEGKPCDTYIPQKFKNVITVGGTQFDDRRFYSGGGSNFGCTDIWAPGHGLWSTNPRDTGTPYVGRLFGTSYACPYVAAAAALKFQNGANIRRMKFHGAALVARVKESLLEDATNIVSEYWTSEWNVNPKLVYIGDASIRQPSRPSGFGVTTTYRLPEEVACPQPAHFSKWGEWFKCLDLFDSTSSSTTTTTNKYGPDFWSWGR